MKTALLTGIRQFEIKEVPAPQVRRGSDVLVRIKTVGVCGSDIHYYTDGRIGTQVIEFPFTIGHEAAGVVEAVGKRVVRVKTGMRIAIDPAATCGRCDQCLAGRPNTCRKLLFLGCPKQLDGCLSEYIVIPEHCCFPIQANMSFEQAVLSEPLAIAVYTVERSLPVPGANIAILGLGPIGLSIFHILRTKNIGRIFVTDKIKERLAFATKLNPYWSGQPDRSDIVKEIIAREPLSLDIVYECSGDPQAMRQAVRLLKPGGKLVLVGIPEVDEISFPIHELRRNEVTLINIRRQADCTQKALDLIDQKLVVVDDLVTHRFSLEQTAEAFGLVADYRDGVMKAVINIGS